MERFRRPIGGWRRLKQKPAVWLSASTSHRRTRGLLWMATPWLSSVEWPFWLTNLQEGNKCTVGDENNELQELKVWTLDVWWNQIFNSLCLRTICENAVRVFFKSTWHCATSRLRSDRGWSSQATHISGAIASKLQMFFYKLLGLFFSSQTQPKKL